MEARKTVCKNPWCKALFEYSEMDMIVIKEMIDSKNKVIGKEQSMEIPSECPKCKSFNTQLSGGVEWKDKVYDGPRFDGTAHQIKYKVTNFRI
jgi:hypothetical protein